MCVSLKRNLTPDTCDIILTASFKSPMPARLLKTVAGIFFFQGVGGGVAVGGGGA